ncbi:MAG: glycine--tRNA ligase subunit beta, partial [Alphaproteobacteria bacterium]
MAEFLLELFCEEIPAGYQAAAAADLARRLDAGLAAARLAHGPVLSGVTPRRLWAVVADVAEGQPDLREERRGPRADAPDKAVAGFLKANGLEREQVETRETERGAFLFAVIEQAGKPSVDLLPAIVQQVVESLSWPKSMRWSDNRLRWVRPLRSVLALFAGQVLPGGLDLSPGVLTFGNATAGHRFLAPEPFRVRDFAEYRDRLRAAYV